MDRAHELGINFFDTANRYGGVASPPGQVANTTSRIRGGPRRSSALVRGRRRRRERVLATKLYGAMGDWPNDGKLSALNIRRACDASLRRLQTDYIDLYQMHHVDRDTPWEEIWQAMEVLVAQGKILYVGTSNFAGWHIAPANGAAAARDFFGLVSEQSIYNLMTRKIELEVLPAAIAYGVGVIPWSPLQGGMLGGCSRRSAKGAAAWPAAPGRPWSAIASRSRRTRTCAMSSARSQPAWRWPGCCTRRASPGRSSGRAPWASSTTRSAR